MSTMRAALAALLWLSSAAAFADGDDRGGGAVQLGPRPFYLVDRMSPGSLKDRLQNSRSG